ncbi:MULTISPECIES: response regulator [unclassified Leucobacter]|uniref:response regulator n=1 Tax=unclassified Leucobacter TaxID=2621730 RepID=UPI00203C9F66|nr:MULTISPECIES: response regulator [unclassified Leucobacter]
MTDAPMHRGEFPKVRVLIVDDDAGARMLHSRFVASTPGFSLAAAVGTGQDAVSRILRKDIDLVLLDMRLPDISGVEVLNRVRMMGPASPDVLVISASQDRVTVRQALAGQVIGYLVKPFTEAALASRLHAYLDGLNQGPTRPADVRELPLAQGEIDQLLSTGSIQTLTPTQLEALSVGAPTSSDAAAPAVPHRLPKGISPVTLAEVIAALDPVMPRTTASLSAACEISPATARRYLDYLVERGTIDLSHRYGKRGRPEVLYRLVPAPGA